MFANATLSQQTVTAALQIAALKPSTTVPSCLASATVLWARFFILLRKPNHQKRSLQIDLK